MSTLLTDKKINSLKLGQWATETNARGAGQLQARGLQNKRVAYYFRYTDISHQQIRIPLGTGLSLLEARRQTSSLSRQLQDGFKAIPLPCRTPKSSVSKHRKIEKTITQASTLGTLLLTYVTDLQRRDCTSAREVENTFKRHIHQAYPQYWNFPATAITTDHLLLMIRAVADQGKLRAADKLRCYIRAAYAAAIQARQHIEGLPAFIALNINSNPARDIPPIRNSSNTKTRVLSITELQTYWQHIKNLNTPAGALLRFHLLTGAQRIEQLRRASLEHYDPDTQTLTLYDPKGRRHQPRLHTIPILSQAQQAMQDMCSAHHNNPYNNQGNQQAPYIWSVTQGQYGACNSTASKALKQVIQEIRTKEAKNSEGGSFLTDFTLGDLRRTVETRLAAAGVSRETRAQLQSHGLSGVQVRHYDRHDYLQEKRQALEILYQLLELRETSAKQINPISVSTPQKLPQKPERPPAQPPEVLSRLVRATLKKPPRGSKTFLWQPEQSP